MPGFIRRRSKGSWEVTVELGRDPTTGKRRRRTETVKGTRRDAERMGAGLAYQLESGIEIEPGKLTVGAYLGRWLVAVKPNLAPSTLLRYDGLVRSQVMPNLGGLMLSKLRPLHVQTMYGELKEHGRVDGRGGLASRTLLHVHRVLSEALRQAVRWQLIGRNVCEAVEPPQARRAEMKTFSPEEVRVLLNVAEERNAVYGDAIALAVHSGLRMGELLGLHWLDVDLDHGRIVVRTALQRLPHNVAFREPKT